jgi:hypothetical protein
MQNYAGRVGVGLTAEKFSFLMNAGRARIEAELNVPWIPPSPQIYPHCRCLFMLAPIPGASRTILVRSCLYATASSSRAWAMDQIFRFQ